MSQISIVVPVYKAENVLKKCIDSILTQTYTDFELILVDDGSPDLSGKICDDYAVADKRVSVIHKKNGGVSSARNEGIKNAKGEYICFVDSDDYIEPTYLEILIETKRLYKDIDNVWCCFQTVSDYNGNNRNEVRVNTDKEILLYSCSDIMTLHSSWFDASPCNKLYNTDTIKDNNLLMDENLSLGEDLIFNLQYLDCTNKKIVIINKCLYNYLRSGAESLDNKYYPELLEIYKRINSELLYYTTKWNISEIEKKKYYSAVFYKYEVVLKNTFNRKNSQSYFEKLKYNNSILKSNEFVDSLENMDGKLFLLNRLAYKTRNYTFVRIVNYLVDILSKIKNRIKK